MKIVQLFTSREEIEKEKIRELMEKHQNAWLKNSCVQLIFLPVAEIVFIHYGRFDCLGTVDCRKCCQY